MIKNPTTFISYAWESDDLKNWVKHLATQLRENGIDVSTLPNPSLNSAWAEISLRQKDYG